MNDFNYFLFLLFLLIDIICLNFKIKLSFVLKEEIVIIGVDFFGFKWYIKN